MDTHHYHILKKENKADIAQTLFECFKGDPLYEKLVPNKEAREKILQDVFSCDASEMLNYCNVLSDSPLVKGILILTDSTEKRSLIRQFFAERIYALKTELGLIKNDHSLKTLFRFFQAHDMLVSKWTAKVHAEKQIHIIYLAVKTEYHGQGVANKLMLPVLEYADKNGITVTLETHNEHNITLYKHYGFDLYQTMDGVMGLKQFCFIRKPILEINCVPSLVKADSKLSTLDINFNPINNHTKTN